MTILGAFLGLLEYTANSWSRQLQDLRLSHTDTSRRLLAIATAIQQKCDTQDAMRQKEVQKQRDRSSGILDPDHPSLLEKFRYYSFDFYDSKEINEELENTDDYVCGVARGFARNLRNTDDIGELTVIWNETFKTKTIIKSGQRKSLLFVLQGDYVEQQREMQNIKSQIDTLSWTQRLRTFSPFLLALGLGIRLAKTHYEVKKEKASVSSPVHPG
jgi:hypothetical protein